jgi:hypothetical protein
MKTQKLFGGESRTAARPSAHSRVRLADAEVSAAHGAGLRLRLREGRRSSERAASPGRIATKQLLRGAALFLAAPAWDLTIGSQLISHRGTRAGATDRGCI